MHGPFDPNHSDRFMERKWTDPVEHPPLARPDDGKSHAMTAIFVLAGFAWLALAYYAWTL